VQEAAVIGSPDDIRGLIVKAFIILKPGFTPSYKLVREIQTCVKKVIAPYKYPRAIEFVDSLPKTIFGKIKRNELREQEHKKFMMENIVSKNTFPPLHLINCEHNLYRREGSQARSTAPGSGPGLAGVLGFESHPSHSSGHRFFKIGILFITAYF